MILRKNRTHKDTDRNKVQPKYPAALQRCRIDAPLSAAGDPTWQAMKNVK